LQENECVPGGPRLCRTRRITIAASRARPSAARATRSPPPATAGGWECATGGRREYRIRRRHEPTSPCRRATLPPPPTTAGGELRACLPTYVPHPARRDRSEPSTSQSLSCDATDPACHGQRRDARRAAHVCTASFASRLPRAQHVPVQLVRRDRPRLLRPADGNVQRRDGRPTRVPHPAPHDRSTSRCRSCDATAPACHGRRQGCAPGGTRVCRIPRVAIVASRARPRAARATRPPPPATAGGEMRAGRPTWVPHRRLAIAANRARPSAARATRTSRLATAGGGMGVGLPKCVPHPAHHDRREPSTSPCRPRDATAAARHGRRRIVSRVAARMPHPVRRNRSEPSTCPCRWSDATAPACQYKAIAIFASAVTF
jgi:hypothetical protein